MIFAAELNKCLDTIRNILKTTSMSGKYQAPSSTLVALLDLRLDDFFDLERVVIPLE